MLERIAGKGRTAAGPAHVVAKSWLSLGVRSGSPAPDISSVAALCAALRAAKSIAYSKEGKSGMLMAALVERLGLTAELAARTIRETRPGGAAFNLAEGKAELAFTIASEIVPVAGARLAGRLPPEVAQCVTFAAGFSPGADAAAQAFVERLRSPAAAPAFVSSGLELP
jgi:molybdate transport system substrate-binding protein